MRALSVDAVVGCDELTLELADELELLAPHGLGNRRVTLLVHGAEVVAPRLTRNKKHMQYRIRRDGFSCRAIHFNFGQLREVDGPGRYDVPVTLSKNEYNGCVSAQVAVKTLFPLAEPAVDLCPASCSTACADRLRGDAVWEELLQFRLEPTAGVEERLERARREGEFAIAAGVRPRRRSPRWRPAVSAFSCWSPTWPGAALCSAAAHSRRTWAVPPCTCRRHAWGVWASPRSRTSS